METHTWDRGTRLVHSALAVAVLLELFTGVVVSEGSHPAWLWVHTLVGLLTAVIIIVHWLWTWAHRDIGVLFPWNRPGMTVVGRELLGVWRGALPGYGDTVGLSSFVHGVGLLAVSGMALTGVVMYGVIPGGYGLSLQSSAYGLFTWLATTHLLLSYVVWFYLTGHLVFAALHQVHGNRVLQRIYSGDPRP